MTSEKEAALTKIMALQKEQIALLKERLEAFDSGAIASIPTKLLEMLKRPSYVTIAQLKQVVADCNEVSKFTGIFGATFYDDGYTLNIGMVGDRYNLEISLDFPYEDKGDEGDERDKVTDRPKVVVIDTLAEGRYASRVKEFPVDNREFEAAIDLAEQYILSLEASEKNPEVA